MRFYIDKFIKIGGSFIVHGWSESFEPGDEIIITAGSVRLKAITCAVFRNDLPPIFGAGSELWGFRVFGVDQSEVASAATTIGIIFSNGDQVESLSTACVPSADHSAHLVWANFIREANAKGGRLVEIGSRARSGSTIRNQLGSNVEYIGVDVIKGQNVDIVADAHHLSEFINKPVDYVCSISTFEHFIMPWKVVLEINKILPIGGKVFSHSHQTWPEHDVPFDYFRFSEHAWLGLFNSHTGFQITDAKSGHPVSVSATYNVGGPFEEMERSPGYAMSVCVAEKTSEAMVAWESPINLVRTIDYNY